MCQVCQFEPIFCDVENVGVYVDVIYSVRIHSKNLLELELRLPKIWSRRSLKERGHILYCERTVKVIEDTCTEAHDPQAMREVVCAEQSLA